MNTITYNTNDILNLAREIKTNNPNLSGSALTQTVKNEVSILRHAYNQVGIKIRIEK